MEAARVVKDQGGQNDLLTRLAADPIFAATAPRFDEILNPKAFTGRASQQVTEYLEAEVKPLLEAYPEEDNGEEVNV
jgi:adenylosuccinate lyase